VNPRQKLASERHPFQTGIPLAVIAYLCPDQGLLYGKWSFERLLHPSKLLKSKKHYEKGKKRPYSLRRKWD
tara:strand:+ start:26 stop:238 length:213 start_codon:yes stop_codon:yes gene_type:complete